MNFKKKSFNNDQNKFLPIIFLLFIFIIFIINIISKDKTFSSEENRTLNTRPKFSMENLMHSDYTKKYESYVSDQFFLRNFWVNIKSSVERFSGKKENNDIYICSDDYLIDKFKKPNKENALEKSKAIKSFYEKNKDLTNSIMIIPTKIKVLKDKLPAFAPSYDELNYINNFYSYLPNNVNKINAFNILNQNKDKYIYYKTDHHWTTEGAYYAYLEFCKKLNITPKLKNQYNIEEVSNNFYGTLYSKSGIKNISPDRISVFLPKNEENLIVNYIEEKKKGVSLYSAHKLNTKDKYSLFTDGNHPILKIETESLSNKKLLIIKDSYANSFIPFLTSHYSDIVVVDLRYYNDNIQSLIEDNGITDTLILYNTSTFSEDDSILNLVQ
ncbi:DHHW family protein [Haloimpatiens sp. FM7315]|uniref:DHHW family protein n=1 Tax=Haloimpatiens sp. FM7315 TaxID=3298609 RepID=UPI0035A35954